MGEVEVPRVLVCDDDADIRTVVGLNLGLVGMDFGEAGSGEEALELLSTQEWHALVLDLIMPKGDGIEVLKQLRERSSKDLAIVVLSARNSPQAALRALKLGAHAHVTKPFSPMALAQVLEELISMSHSEREARRLGSVERASRLERMGIPTI
jgi:CheY-like chemotaxis protein